MKSTLAILPILTCMCLFCNAQQVVPSRGYEIKKEITVEWVLGGTLNTLNSFVVYDRFEQENELKIDPLSLLTVKVYPTVTRDFATVEITSQAPFEYLLKLYDCTGRKVINALPIKQQITQINLTILSPGVYCFMLYEAENQLPIDTGRIVKL